jgi:multiple sugar transport system permease protein
MGVATRALDQTSATSGGQTWVVADVRRPSRVRHWRSIVRFTILSVLAVFWAAPVAWMVLTSLKPEAQTISDPPHWFPEKLSDFTLENYDNALFYPRGVDLIQAFQNSLVVTVVGTALTLLINVPAGYVFARMRFPGRDLLFAVVVASLIVPGEILLVPNYVTVWKFGWLNDYKALILPPLASAFGVFLLRQFMLGIPRELEDAAKLDGAGHLRILWNIVIPSTRGAIAALGIFTFLFYWNEFTWPYITINTADQMTMPVALIQFRADFAITYGLQMAGATVSALPAIVLFLVAQRMIIRSITLTGIKG